MSVGRKANRAGSASTDAQWEAVLPEIAALLELPHLRVNGLMTMPPLGMDPEDSRKYFQRLRLLRDRLVSQFPQADWHELSMGTSSDFQVAVEEGATLVRVGTAIVGARNYTSEAER